MILQHRLWTQSGTDWQSFRCMRGRVGLRRSGASGRGVTKPEHGSKIAIQRRERGGSAGVGPVSLGVRGFGHHFGGHRLQGGLLALAMPRGSDKIVVQWQCEELVIFGSASKKA